MNPYPDKNRQNSVGNQQTQRATQPTYRQTSQRQAPRQTMNGQPMQNRQMPQQNYDPQRAAAKRAYYEKKRKQRRRRLILLICAAVVVLALAVFLLVLIGRGIAAAIRGSEGKHGEASCSETGAVKSVQTEDIGVSGTDTEAVSAPETAEPEPEYTLDFQADLSEYEKYMEPEARDAYLILVNPSHPLTADDAPDDLIDVVNTRTDGRATQKMRKTAEKALEALYLEAYAEGMMSAASPSGYPLSVTSAYRDFGYQDTLFTQYTQNEMANNPSLSREQAEAIVETYSCRPGTSEHQTGLCCDMHNLSGADISFANQEVAGWLAENAWKFGFILRFPKDKTAETGISYEPWHFRFVGRYHAYKIHEAGLCLEEYVAQLADS